jgi:Secretion system C-terminal sorting domain
VGGSGTYKYSLDGGPQQPVAFTSGSTLFTGVTGGTHTVVVTDNLGNTASNTITIAAPAQINPNCNNSNPVLYFGYAADQTATISVTPTGGTAPYTVNFTLSRALLCNQVNTAGDEVWTPGANTGITTGNTCGGTPSSTSTIGGIAAGGSYSVNVLLIADAVITATVTDACGNSFQCTTQIFAEDVRCYPGDNVNSNNTKVKLCHKTGSSCATLCVAPDAVAAHLAHGDFLGDCPPVGCVNPNPGNITVPTTAKTTGGFSTHLFEPKVYPNPSINNFRLQVVTSDKEDINVTITDILGRQVRNMKVKPYQQIEFGNDLKKGIYMIHVKQGDHFKTIKLQKL